jgi:hypothetical protein
MLVHINDPSALKPLVESLVRADCSCTPTGRRTLRVRHPSATDEREARLELTFFLKAWLAHYPGVRLRLVPAD